VNKSKDKDLPILVSKADKHFRISPQEITSLSGSRKKLIIEHAVGVRKAVSVMQAMGELGLRDKYLEKQAELRKKWRGDQEGFEQEDFMWLKHFKSQARGAFNRAIDEWEKFYGPQDIFPCATWIPTGDKDKGSLFSLLAMIELSSGKLAVGTDADYAKYLWMIKRQTQSSAEKHKEITRLTHEYLKMGHAGKEIQYFLTQMVKEGASQELPPALGFTPKENG